MTTSATDAAPGAAAGYGVHSEVGRLRKVLVCRPGLAHKRLTPTNADDLLFDDVMWVESAQRDHADFVNKLRSRGVEVVELHDLLGETMTNSEARSWLLDRKLTRNLVGLGLVDDTRAFLESLPPERYPRLVEAATPLSEGVDPDAYFAFGLDLLLAGIEAMAARKR